MILKKYLWKTSSLSKALQYSPISSKTISCNPVNFLEKLQLLIAETASCGVHLSNSTMTAACQFPKSWKIVIPKTMCLAVLCKHDYDDDELFLWYG